MKFLNPRRRAEFDNWPIGGTNRGKCVFSVEHRHGKGDRLVKQTTDKFGRWCNPKNDTYHERVVVVDGDDNRTYGLALAYGMIRVIRSDFKSTEYIHRSEKPAEYAAALALIESVPVE